MKFAVIKTGGKQYLVKENDILLVEKIGKEKGEILEFDKVLLFIDKENKKIKIGKPYLENVKVEAEILEQVKGKKITIIKYKPKIRYRRKKGHRQPYTKIKILKIYSKK